MRPLSKLSVSKPIEFPVFVDGACFPERPLLDVMPFVPSGSNRWEPKDFGFDGELGSLGMNRDPSRSALLILRFNLDLFAIPLIPK